jgi:hypothetical protein
MSYPTVLPSLGAGDFAELAARRRNATRDVQHTEAQAAAGQGRVADKFSLFTADLDRSFGQKRTEVANRYGDRGMARQPRMIGRAFRSMRDDHAGALASGESAKAEELATLSAMVADARRRRENELALVDADEVRRRTDFNRLLTRIGY